MGITDRLLNGGDLPPGTPLYVRFRAIDIYGNKSSPSPATSVVLRYTDQNPGAKVFRATTNSASFIGGQWTAYPFHNDATGGAYDVYNNWTTNIATGTLPPLTSPPTANFFRMPCDGLAKVSARMGVFNDGSDKPDAWVHFGLFRLGSAMPGGDASHPLFNLGGFQLREGQDVPVDTITSAFWVGTTVSSLFVNISGEISAYSGDYILAGVFPDHTTANSIHAVKAANPSSVSASYIHINVVQD